MLPVVKSQIRYFSKQKGMSLVEMIISFFIAVFAMLMIYHFLSGTRMHFMHGTVNLQNLQEARLAINYLRRDFKSATPFLANPNASYELHEAALRQLFSTPSTPNIQGSQLMQVQQSNLRIFTFVFGDDGEQPLIQEVTYEFDAPSKTLTRRSLGAVSHFKGFEEVSFRLYTHEVNPNVPLLWVSFKIHEGESIYGTEDIGTAMELTTTIASPFAASAITHPYWRNETSQRMN